MSYDVDLRRWFCDGEGCRETRKHLPRGWYATQVEDDKGRRAARAYCRACLSSLYRRLVG